MAKSKHDKVADKIAKQEGTEYNRGQGADIRGPKRIIEVETPRTIGEAGRQLQGHQKPVYVIPTDKKAIPDAVKRYKKTTIGVMAPSGKIVKRSTRGRKK